MGWEFDKELSRIGGEIKEYSSRALIRTLISALFCRVRAVCMDIETMSAM